MTFPLLAQSVLRAGWSVPNYRARPVSRLEGPAFTCLAVVGAVSAGAPAAPVICAGTGALLAGRIDDLWGGEDVRGLRGHFMALRRGRITTGMTKVILLTATGALAALPAHRSHGSSASTISGVALADSVAVAGCIALGANLINLFDVRPGRALKIALAASLPLVSSTSAGGPVLTGVATASMACLPSDLAERSMLGDAGANPAGALTGLGLALMTGPRGRLLLLAAMSALTVASEAISFSQVIAALKPLRWLDEFGRRGPA